MFINKKYRNRHLFLKTLQLYFEENDRPDLYTFEEISLTFPKLVELSNLTEKEIYGQIDYLEKEGEINIEHTEHFSTFYFISRNGTIAYYDKKYLNLGKKEFLNDAYDILKNISAIILLVIAIISFIINFLDTRKNKKEIEQIKVKLEKLSK
jgi:hypothetical protein